jgi:protein involved in polysaccharide export with SLBB domain
MNNQQTNIQTNRDQFDQNNTRIAPPVPATVLPPPEPTDFQRLAQQTLGRPIPIFGHTLFENPQTYSALNDAQATADYVISTGDEILVHVWGPIQIDSRLVVDRAGNIYIPRVGEVHVAGYTYQNLDAHVREAIGQVFHNVNIAVDLGHLRSIQIFITGMAVRPGTLVVSSQSTLINAIFASGGPAPMGSYRHIQLRRGSAIVTDLDLYDLIIRGDKSKDVRLLPGDVIYIPPVGSQIAVGGSVKEPAIYEVLQGSTLKDALQMAGGTLNTADTTIIKLERIVDHDHRDALELTLPKDDAFPLKDGDLIAVRSISPRFDQTITIRGNLLNPGRFAWHPGMKLSEIIPNKESLLTANYWQARNVEGNPRPFQTPFQLPNQNPAQFLNQVPNQTPAQAQNQTPNQIPNQTYPQTAMATAPDGLQAATVITTTQVQLPAPEINWSYALIERTNTATLKNELIPFNLGKLVLEHAPSEDLELQPGDIVTIFSHADIQVPVNQQTRFVRVDGEIVHAGFYIIEPGDTLQSVLTRAGGVTSRGYLYATELIRPSEQAKQQQQLDQYIRKLSQESQKSAANLALNSGSTASSAQGTIANLQGQLILQLQTERASGRVSLNIPPSATSVSDVPPMLLENGDVVSVPSVGSTVNIIGSVYNPSLYQYADSKNVKYYLQLAGGADRDADPRHMFIIRANGSVVSKQQDNGRFDKLRLLPGDALVVPAKLYSVSKMKVLLDSLTAYGQIGLLAAVALKP